MIPVFNLRGVLPPSGDGMPYSCRRQEVESRLVLEPGGTWRRIWFDGWDLLRLSIEADVPSARWWMWGDFVSAVAEPFFGEAGSLSAALIVDFVDLVDPATGAVDLPRLTRLSAARSSAEQLHHVDVHGIVYRFPPEDQRSRASDALATKLARRASRSMVGDSKELVDAGYIEVLP